MQFMIFGLITSSCLAAGSALGKPVYITGGGVKVRGTGGHSPLTADLLGASSQQPQASHRYYLDYPAPVDGKSATDSDYDFASPYHQDQNVLEYSGGYAPLLSPQQEEFSDDRRAATTTGRRGSSMWSVWSGLGQQVLTGPRAQLRKERPMGWVSGQQPAGRASVNFSAGFRETRTPLQSAGTATQDIRRRSPRGGGNDEGFPPVPRAPQRWGSAAVPSTPHPEERSLEALRSSIIQQQLSEDAASAADRDKRVQNSEGVSYGKSPSNVELIPPYHNVNVGHNYNVSARNVDGREDTEDWLSPRVAAWAPVGTPVTTAVLGSIMLCLILLVVVLALKVQWGEQRRKDASPQILDPEAQQEVEESSMSNDRDWVVASPVVQPPTPASGEPPRVGLLPPDGTPIPLYDHPLMDPQDPLTHLTVEPIRIKAKGLLERRGSNTSLTLELVPTSTPESSSPPRTCTGEQFLLTAGNRMGRRQLRQSLNEGRTLHAEFWEVPSNHPDRCEAPGSASRNRYRTVLPNDHSRVHIAAPHPEGEYINANYIRGFDGEERSYIATQGPLAHTVADLWTMVLQERAPAIIMITRLKEKGRVKCEPYIPEYSAHYENITVTVQQVIQKNGYTIRQIHLQQGDVEHETLHFWYTAWPDHKTPSSAKQLVSMAVQVEEVRKDSLGVTRGPVVVHCSAGIGRTGCFIAISIAISQLHEDDAVDILGILCQMRIDRGGMVQTAEQYEFIHRAVAMYEEALPAIHTGK